MTTDPRFRSRVLLDGADAGLSQAANSFIWAKT